MSKTVEIRSLEHFEQLLRSSKIVLVDFWADWCAPCKVIGPHFEKLAEKLARPNTITFAKVDNDKHDNLVAKYKVTALPTIILFENGKETQRFKGSDISSLTKITERFASVASSEWSNSTVPRGYADITSEVDLLGLELLNADAHLAGPRILFNDSKPSGVESASGKGKGKASDEAGANGIDWVESDTDAQLMLFVPFQSSVKIHSIRITSFANRTEDDDDDDVPGRPQRIELYTNRSHNLGFEEAEDTPETQSIEVQPADWNAETSSVTIETRFVKFQNVTSLVLFVVDAQNEAEKTRIDRIRIIGQSGEKRAMGKLEKIGDEPGE